MKLTLLLGFSFTSLWRVGVLWKHGSYPQKHGWLLCFLHVLPCSPAHSAEDGLQQLCFHVIPGFPIFKSPRFRFHGEAVSVLLILKAAGRKLMYPVPRRVLEKWQVVNTCCWMRWMDLESLMIHFPLPAHSFLDSIFLLAPREAGWKWGRCLACCKEGRI